MSQPCAGQARAGAEELIFIGDRTGNVPVTAAMGSNRMFPQAEAAHAGITERLADRA